MSTTANPWWKSKKFISMVFGVVMIFVNDPPPLGHDSLIALIVLIGSYIGIEGHIDAQAAKPPPSPSIVANQNVEAEPPLLDQGKSLYTDKPL